MHRMSNILLFNRIFVLDRGKLVGEGTFEELCRNCPTFRLLWEFFRNDQNEWQKTQMYPWQQRPKQHKSLLPAMGSERGTKLSEISSPERWVRPLISMSSTDPSAAALRIDSIEQPLSTSRCGSIWPGGLKSFLASMCLNFCSISASLDPCSISSEPAIPTLWSLPVSLFPLCSPSPDVSCTLKQKSSILSRMPARPAVRTFLFWKFFDPTFWWSITKKLLEQQQRNSRWLPIKSFSQDTPLDSNPIRNTIRQRKQRRPNSSLS